jgi:hypothetical protein
MVASALGAASFGLYSFVEVIQANLMTAAECVQILAGQLLMVLATLMKMFGGYWQPSCKWYSKQ